MEFLLTLLVQSLELSCFSCIFWSSKSGINFICVLPPTHAINKNIKQDQFICKSPLTFTPPFSITYCCLTLSPLNNSCPCPYLHHLDYEVPIWQGHMGCTLAEAQNTCVQPRNEKWLPKITEWRKGSFCASYQSLLLLGCFKDEYLKMQIPDHSFLEIKYMIKLTLYQLSSFSFS